jgi:hypothetical protein
MIVLQRKLDPPRREMIKWQEDNVQSVEQEAGEKLGKARFAAYGKTTYPDATFTLRLSYGQVNLKTAVRRGRRRADQGFR